MGCCIFLVFFFFFTCYFSKPLESEKGINYEFHCELLSVGLEGSFVLTVEIYTSYVQYLFR